MYTKKTNSDLASAQRKAKQNKSTKDSSKPYGGIKPDEKLFARLNISPKFNKYTFKQDQEFEEDILKKRERKLYEVDDVQKELEDLTENSDEI